jgi:hypothetical protein
MCVADWCGLFSIRDHKTWDIATRNWFHWDGHEPLVGVDRIGSNRDILSSRHALCTQTGIPCMFQ